MLIPNNQKKQIQDTLPMRVLLLLDINAHSPIEVIVLGNITDVKSHPSKVPFSILVTDEGIIRVPVNPTHIAKADSPIVDTDEGIEIVVIFLQE